MAMRDLRTRLERLGDRVVPAPDAYERLERVRRRRHRNRRLVAGFVAFAIAIVGSLAAFAAFRGAGPTPANAEDGFFALWPEQTYEAALAEQAAIDQGALSRRAWRLDPMATAREFVRTALGWGWDPSADDEIGTEVVAGDPSRPGPLTIDLRLFRHGSDELPPLEVSVTLARLLRPDGIWSVVDVGSGAFDLRVGPGEEVTLGEFLAIATTLDEGTQVAVGVAGSGSCAGFREQTAEVIDGHVVLPVRGVTPGCRGYLYVLTPDTPTGQVELGRIMFVWGDPKPPLGYTIESIAAAPVRFVAPSAEDTPSAGPASPGTLRLTCDPSSITVAETLVTAQPAGVNVVVDNRSEDPVFLQFAPEPEGPWGGTEVPPGITELSLQAPPGTLTVRCSDGGDAVTSPIEIDVRDDLGLFVPFDLTCGGSPGLASTIPSSPWSGDGAPTAPEPIEFVRAVTKGLLPGDVVERAGYPAAPGGIVRVVRDGAVVATFGLFQPEDWAPGMLDGWAASMSACAGSGISIPPGPDPYPRGWFEWCPQAPFPEPGRDWSDRASEAAVRFAQAYVDGDPATLAKVLDPSVPAGAEFPVVLAEGADPTVAGTDAHGGQIVNYSCGNDVDAYTVAVTIDDGSDSASADFTVFLILREDGWKVWGVY
jgi:hypothetical protein